MFRNNNLKTEIFDVNDPKIKDFNFIYNRYTDFFLIGQASKTIRDLYLSRQACVSPHPLEYALVADKSLYEIWQTHPAAEDFRPYILKSFSMDSKSPEEIWAQRKHWFFKPKNSYGSKQTYRGASVSRKAFEETCNENFIAQEFVPPSELDFIHEGQTHRMRYDLRCYYYQDRLQMVIARLYQGQVTNLKTPLGGFAPVIFST